MKPLILISNDDGYQAKGIRELVKMIADLGDIIVCAPDGGRSGKSRAFSMEMLTMKKIEEIHEVKELRSYEVKDDRTSASDSENEESINVQIYSCSGTPVDCVKMAYHQICPRKPSLVIGGINHGDNASTNAHYSGTVGIVIEGAMKGIPSIAFSLCDYSEDADFEPMRELVRSMVKKVLAEGLPHYVALNVNYPKVAEVKGIKACRMCNGHWRREVDKCHHPSRNYDYYWMTGYYQNDEPDATDTDAWALANGYVSVTPVTVDLTDYGYLAKLKDSLEEKEQKCAKNTPKI